MHRRQYLGLLAVACVAALAGCGFITGSEALTFSASPATASDAAASETGYESQGVTAQNITRNFTVAGQTRQVSVTNQLARYERQVDLGPLGSLRAGVFATYTSPQVEVAGEAFNPIADLSERQLLERANSQYSGISVGDRVGSQNVTALGQSTSVEKFEGTASLDGIDVDVYIHATKLEHEGDFVVAVGIYPQRIDDEAAILTLIESLEHSGEA
jgi:hypothetical protein